MDREGLIRKLIAASLLVMGGAAGLAAALPQMQLLRWTAPGTELEALSRQPSVCLQYDPQNKPLAQAGEALFNAPALLGGQAAKAGLSCASCHVNGRDNPHFLMTGVSNGPGTADVSHSFFSPARGNGVFDPKPIPDLAAPGKVSRDPATKALEPFIRDLIVDEFSGHEPTPAMLEALGAYVRAVKGCPGGDKTPTTRRLGDQMTILDSALAGAGEMAARGDKQAADLLIAAARHQLGLVSERYSGPKLKRERAQLLAASRELQRLSAHSASAKEFQLAIAQWKARFDKPFAERLFLMEKASLYHPKLLRRAYGPKER